MPTLLNDVIDDPTFKTFYRSCSTDLCNDGDGTKSSTSSNISPDGYNGENLLVPGLPFNGGVSGFLSGWLVFLILIMAIAIN